MKIRNTISRRCYLTLILIGLFWGGQSLANPYHDPDAVPTDPPSLDALAREFSAIKVDRGTLGSAYEQVLRVDIEWLKETDQFQFVAAKLETSGTEYLAAKSRVAPKFGSYIGIIEDKDGKKYYSAIGTGQEFRKLVRGLSFRFPAPYSPVTFTLIAENPQSGSMNEVLTKTITLKSLSTLEARADLDIRRIKIATASPVVKVSVYADGYLEDGRQRFFQGAQKVAAAFAESNLPNYANLEINAVFAVSKLQLGRAIDLGLPVPERDSFLGLYYPYWNAFGRWYHVVYPTNFQKYRDAIGQVPYDYPLALIDSRSYWGVGNYMELTAIPSESSSFKYLLIHEFGHFLGLNEEYEGGGPTELEFAPEILEPWSQNITFNPEKGALKWAAYVAETTPLPTPYSTWNSSQKGPIGAYKGGYADSATEKSYKPGFACVMESHSDFCPVCLAGIMDEFLVGMEQKSQVK